MRNALQKMIHSAWLLFLIAVFAGLAPAADSKSLTKAEAKQLIAKASTAEDHHKLAAYFTEKAERLEAEASEHEELAKEYARNPGIHEMKHPMSPNTAAHCKYFAEAARKAAKEDRALAAAHEAMAKTAQK